MIGSDEVFNCTQAGSKVGYSRQLFGLDHKAEILISYAATFGTTTMEKLKGFGIDTEVAALLNRFDAISVRDSHSVRMIEELCDKTPKRHIDPVLLYDFSEANDIPVTMKDYIVVYAYSDRLNNEEVKAIREFATKHHKKILSLGYYQSFCDEYILVSPLEVLAYIKHADYVITDTFHGTVFSIKYQKQFATIVRESNRQKLMGLLQTFNLEDRCVMDLNTLESIIMREIPASTNQCLADEQKWAIEFLEKELM